MALSRLGPNPVRAIWQECPLSVLILSPLRGNVHCLPDIRDMYTTYLLRWSHASRAHMRIAQIPLTLTHKRRLTLLPPSKEHADSGTILMLQGWDYLVIG